MKKETKDIIKYLLLIAIFLGMLNLFIPRNTVVNESMELKPLFFKSENSTMIYMKVPAVDPDEKGSSVLLGVEAVKGTGRTLVDIDSLLFWADTQQSIRMARLIAGNVSGRNLSNYDLIYSIKAKASVIGGPSAGAAIALATIFALNGEEPLNNVMITGTINHDGTIGPVDSILEKAKAAKQFNASILLVPLLQGKDVVYETNDYCHKFGETEVCTKESVPREVNIANETGVKVIEVKNIEEALKYFKP